MPSWGMVVLNDMLVKWKLKINDYQTMFLESTNVILIILHVAERNVGKNAEGMSGRYIETNTRCKDCLRQGL